MFIRTFFVIPIIFAEVLAVPLIAEGVGDVVVRGDDIAARGVTAVDGAVPIAGTVAFSGPVMAAGTVTIIGRCGPSRPAFPAYLPIERLPLAPMPLAEIPAAFNEEPVIGYGSLSVLGEMPVKGVTEVDGFVPIVGDVTFGGLVLGKGVVVISGSCSY